MRRTAVRSALSIVAATAVVSTGLGTQIASAAPTGDKFANVTAPTSVVTGGTWAVSGDVVDSSSAPAPNQTVWYGIDQPSLGCGNGDVTSTDCTDLATFQTHTDSNGHFTITDQSDLDTTVVTYLSDDINNLDPSTGQMYVIHTHNSYKWSGPTSATLRRSQVGKAASMNPANVVTASGPNTAVPHTQVSTDGGTHWTTISTGEVGGALPVPSPFGTGPVSLFASKSGTYQVRVQDTAGAFEDAFTSATVIVHVTARTLPQWLTRTNKFRTSVGLPAIADNPAYDAALAKHVHWMHVHRTLSHTETPHTTAYTSSGNRAGQSSDIAFGATKQTRTVDLWMGGPFHAVCLLNPYWAVGGYAIESAWSGEWCQSDLQTLDLAAHTNAPNATNVHKPLTFPSAKMPVPTTLLANSGESPDPVAHCGHAYGGWSVPVIFRVPKPPAADKNLRHATATLKSNGRRITPSCVITGSTYRGDSGSETQIGRAILGSPYSGRWAVLLVRTPLKRGHSYTATLTDGGYRQRTTFTIAKR